MEGSDQMMSGVVDSLIDQAGGSDKVISVLRSLSPKKIEQVRNSNHLDRYLRKSFLTWIDYDKSETNQPDRSWKKPRFALDIEEICVEVGGVGFPLDGKLADDFEREVREVMGDHLLSLHRTEEGDEIGVWVNSSIPFRCSYILSHRTGKTVSPDSIPEWSDDSTVRQITWATENEPLSTQLRQSNDPLRFFLDKWIEIEESMGESLNDLGDGENTYKVG
jgi:hypothetical protein